MTTFLGCRAAGLIKNSIESLEFKIDLNAKNEDGATAFHLACMYGGSKIAERLIQKSIDFNINLNAKDNGGLTPFHLLVRKVI